jgi:DNA integrity scanning protein DisA with diadenylate cyclase activity
MLEEISALLDRYDDLTLRPLVELAVEIAREGAEGRRIGTLFAVGDADAVMKLSRPMILDPISGHPFELRTLSNPNFRGTIKELAQLDGGFVVSAAGVFHAACRYFEAPANDIAVPMGLGTRHLAAAAMSRATKSIGVVVSESAVVRLFERGSLVAELIPELWLIDRYSVHLQKSLRKKTPRTAQSP